jgi:hypothetical protein
MPIVPKAKIVGIGTLADAGPDVADTGDPPRSTLDAFGVPAWED